MILSECLLLEWLAGFQRFRGGQMAPPSENQELLDHVRDSLVRLWRPFQEIRLSEQDKEKEKPSAGTFLYPS